MFKKFIAITLCITTLACGFKIFRSEAFAFVGVVETSLVVAGLSAVLGWLGVQAVNNDELATDFFNYVAEKNEQVLLDIQDAMKKAQIANGSAVTHTSISMNLTLVKTVAQLFNDYAKTDAQTNQKYFEIGSSGVQVGTVATAQEYYNYINELVKNSTNLYLDDSHSNLAFDGLYAFDSTRFPVVSASSLGVWSAFKVSYILKNNPAQGLQSCIMLKDSAGYYYPLNQKFYSSSKGKWYVANNSRYNDFSSVFSDFSTFLISTLTVGAAATSIAGADAGVVPKEGVTGANDVIDDPEGTADSKAEGKPMVGIPLVGDLGLDVGGAIEDIGNKLGGATVDTGDSIFDKFFGGIKNLWSTFWEGLKSFLKALLQVLQKIWAFLSGALLISAITEAINNAKFNNNNNAEEEQQTQTEKFKILSELKGKFPFCLPFDVYTLFSVLSAEPEAPKFDYLISVPSINFNHTINIDLSQYDNIALIVRRFELLIFCLGLAFLTKKMLF